MLISLPLLQKAPQAFSTLFSLVNSIQHLLVVCVLLIHLFKFVYGKKRKKQIPCTNKRFMQMFFIFISFLPSQFQCFARNHAEIIKNYMHHAAIETYVNVKSTAIFRCLTVDKQRRQITSHAAYEQPVFQRLIQLSTLVGVCWLHGKQNWQKLVEKQRNIFM